ncbi:MAG: tetratricopeptide repeat protein, partial [Candidatus Omnitrophota bacterium]
QNRYDKIMELGKKYISGYPDGEFISRAYFYLGKAFTAKSDYPSAIENYEKGLAKSSDLYISDLIRQAISLVYLEKGDKEKAADFLEEITDPELKLFSVAIFHFSEKQYLDALKSFDDFLAEFPDSQYAYRVYINKAETYYEMGRINDALSLYQYVIKKYVNANDPDTNILDKAHYGLAWCYLKNGEYRRAIEEFRLTLRYTNNPVVKVSSQVQIADTYQQEKKYDLALSMYSDILSDSPGNIYSDYIQFQIAMIFLKQERLPDASLALRALESNYPNSALIPEVKYYLAIGYFSIEDYKNAEKLLETFILKYSGHYLNKKAEYLYAKCLFNLGEYKKALEKFQYIIDNYANDEITELIQIDIGNTYLNMSDMKSAGDVWRDFLVKFPSSKYADSVKLYLGGMHEINNEYDLALNYYRQVMDNENSLLADEAYFDIGHLYFMKNEHEKAKQCFNALALKNNEFAVKAKLYLVKLHSLENDNKQALKLCDEILASDSSLGAAHLEKALILKDTGKLNKAIDAFNLAVSNGVSSAKVHFLFAGTLDKAKKYHEAIDQYFKVIYEFQDSEYFIKAYFQIAKIYERQGNVPAAREIYEKIVALNVPESKIAKVRLEELNKQ